MYTVRPITERTDFTGRHRQSSFDSTWTSTERLLLRELRAISARTVVLELDFREGDLRIDGRPKANARAITPAAALTFETKDGPFRFATDRFWGWQDNVRAIALGLEALRKIERYGIAQGDKQYTGWRQLEARSPDAPGAEEVIRTYANLGDTATLAQCWRSARRVTHPDVWGSREAWDDVEAAGKILGLV